MIPIGSHHNRREQEQVGRYRGATYHWEGDRRSPPQSGADATPPSSAPVKPTTGFDVVMHARAQGRRPPIKPDYTLHCHFRSKCALLDGSESNTSKQPKECHLPAPWGRA